MLFMGQELLADEPVERYARLRHVDSMGRARSRRQDTRHFLRFMRELIGLRRQHRHCEEKAARSIMCMTKDRVWRSSAGSRRGRRCCGGLFINENTLYNYAIGFTTAGRWREVFNSDVYDNG